MKRRGFLAGLLLATTANVVTAQRRGSPAQIGILDPGIPQLFDAFRDGMRSLGYVEGQNINTVLRSAQGRPADVQHLAAELAGLKVDVIVTAGTAPVRAAAEATSSIPIVFAALGDALASGIVTNLFRPGGNLTGLSFLNTEVSSKRLEILVEAVPNVQRIAVFADPTASQSFVEATEQAAKRLGVLPQIINVPRPEALEEAFRAAAGGGAQALNVLASAFFNAHRERLAELAMVQCSPVVLSPARRRS